MGFGMGFGMMGMGDGVGAGSWIWCCPPQMSQFIVQCLNPYRKPDCKVGRITTTEDFKHLARKVGMGDTGMGGHGDTGTWGYRDMGYKDLGTPGVRECGDMDTET